MSVTIYSLGDHEAIRAALNAVAMIFNPSNTEMLAGTGPLGLGYAAGLGLMVSLGLMAFSGLLKQKFEPQHLIVVMLGSAIVFGPKTTVVVEDIFSGRSAVVDDIPIGVAYSGGVLSGMMRSVTIKFDTGLRAVDSNYSSLTEFGLANPLKLIMAARGALGLNANTSKTFNTYISDCVKPEVDDQYLANVTSPIVLLQIPSTTAATMKFTTDYPQGQLVSCKEAADWLVTQLDQIETGDAFKKRLQQIAGKNPQRLDGVYESNDVRSALTMLTDAGFDSHQAMLQLISADLTVDSLGCGNRYLNGSDFVNCTASLRQALEQQKTDAAGQATAFSKSMIPMMNILMFMFYAVAPLIALIVMLSGMHGLTKILPGYFFFGVWSQSWMPIAAVINYFIQKQVRDYFTTLDTSAGIQLADSLALFDQVGLKVAAASDLLAATPVVTLALLSGSIFGLTKLASTAADKFDQGYVSPAARETGAAVRTSGKDVSMTPVGPMTAGASQPFALRMGEQTSAREGVSEALGLGQSQRLMESASERHAQALGVGISGRTSSVSGKFSELATGRESGTAFKFGQAVGRSFGVNLSDSDQKQVSLDFNQALQAVTSAAAMEGAAAGMSGQPLKNFVQQSAQSWLQKTMKGGNSLMKAMPSPALQEAYRTSLDEAINTAFSANRDEVDAWSTRFGQGKRSASEAAYQKEYKQGWDSSSGTELSRAVEDTKKREQSVQKASEVAQTSGLDRVFTPQEIARAAGDGLGFSMWGQEQLAQLGKGEEDIQKEMRQLAAGGILAGGNSARTELNRRNVAIAQLLAKNGQAHSVISTLASGEHWKHEAPSKASVQGDAQNLRDQVGQPGLAPERAAQIEQRANAAAAAGATAQKKTAGVPGQIQQIQGQAQQAIQPSEFDAVAAGQRQAANESGKWDKGVQRALESTFDPQTVQQMNQRREEWKGDHGFTGLAAKFGHDIANDPGAQALVAAVGMAAAAPVLEKAAAAGAAKGLQYVGRVLKEIGKRAPAFAAKVVARHGATAAGMAVPAIGVAANVGLLGVDAYQATQLIGEAMKAADEPGQFLPPAAGGNAPALPAANPGMTSGHGYQPQEHPTGFAFRQPSGEAASQPASTQPTPHVSSGGSGAPAAAAGGMTLQQVMPPAAGGNASAPRAAQEGFSTNPGSAQSPAAPGAEPTPVEAAQRVVSGLSGQDPVGYIRQTLGGEQSQQAVQPGQEQIQSKTQTTNQGVGNDQKSQKSGSR